MTADLSSTIEEFDPADVPGDDTKVSVGELEGDDLPHPSETDLAGSGVALPEGS